MTSTTAAPLTAALRSTAARLGVLVVVGGGVLRAGTPPQSVVLSVPSLELAVDRLMDDRRYPQPPNGLPGQASDRAFLAAGLASPYPDIRAVAVRAVGRFEAADGVPRLLRFFHDTDRNVRVEAGNAVALSLRHAEPAEALPVLQALVALIPVGRPPEGWVYDTLGRLPYAQRDADRIEQLLADADRAQLQGDLVLEGALANLIAGDQARPVATATRNLLETRAKAGRFGPSLPAWRALQLIGDRDPSLLAFGTSYVCGPPECGAGVREIATSMIDPNDPAYTSILAKARHDLFVTARVVAMRQLAKLLPTSKDCSPLVETIDDIGESTVMHLEALSLLEARCDNSGDIAERLATLAGRLSDPYRQAQWHEPARALEALARFDADATRRLIVEVASTHPVWQVRAASVRAAAMLKDAALVRGFASDPEPNVRTEVVNALGALASPDTTAVAIKALESPDYQLVDAAAEALAKRPPREVEVKPLVSALHRLTSEGKDTSHAPRKALLDRLKTLAAIVNAGGDSWVRFVVDDEIAPVVRDWDPDISTLAADVIGIATGVRPDPRPTYRRPEQPTESEIAPLSLPDKATIELDTLDRIDLKFLKTEAPIAIARFAALARKGYYDGAAFYRVVPVLAVQGGSPGANAYMGSDRFFRDEIGLAHHTAGTVGLVTNGRDTGNGQFFIDLTDQPQFDDVYTAFARVVPGPDGPDVLARILEGARVLGITVFQ
jgi:cyclophilin family peptidyl-prolyl cis-trans isomerase/HEAT repeat protein